MVFMIELRLNENQIKLLSLLWIYTTENESEEDIFIKDYALHALIYYLSEKGFFNYNFSGQLVFWRSSWAFINISQRALLDLEYLINLGLIVKIRFSTMTFQYVTAYALSETGKKYLKIYGKHLVEKLRKMLYCEKKKQIYDVEIREDDAYLICGDDEIPMGVKRTKDVSYNSIAILLDEVSENVA